MQLVRIKQPFDGLYYERMVQEHGFLYGVVEDETYNPLTSEFFLVLRSLATGGERIVHRSCMEFLEDETNTP